MLLLCPPHCVIPCCAINSGGSRAVLWVQPRVGGPVVQPLRLCLASYGGQLYVYNGDGTLLFFMYKGQGFINGRFAAYIQVRHIDKYHSSQ